MPSVCYHCGDQCIEDQIHFDDKNFCCHGCQAVYELINQSELRQYYQNADLKAEKIASLSAIERKFAFLDQEEVISKLVRYRDEQKSMVRFYLAGIHCSSCIYLLEHLPKLDDRVIRSEVNFIRKEISLTFDQSMSLRDLAVLLSSIGYEPTINLDSIEEDKKAKKRSTIGLKIAVAGFCFGNSMLISLPEYLDTGFELDAVFKSLFGWINLVLALPVFLYSSQEYFKSAWSGLKHRFLNIDVPISIGILTLFFRSYYEILWDIGPGYIDSLNGLVFFLLIGKWYQNKTYQALSFERDYKSYFPVSVLLKMDNGEKNVLLKDLKKDDEILLHHQELVPADGIIVAGSAKIDYSFVTGEAQPVAVDSGERVFAGGRQIGATITIRLEKSVNNSELTQLWNHESKNEKIETNKSDLIDQVSKYFTVVILGLALATALYWHWTDPTKTWNAVAAVLIVACPCALALSLPFGLGHGMRILGLKGLYLKNAQVIEQLSRTKAIVFDKTGTLTKNDPNSISFIGEKLSEYQHSLIRSACANSAHPLSKMIAAYFGDAVKKLPLDSFDEAIGQGLVAKISGTDIKVGNANWVGQEEVNTLHESRAYLSLGGQYLGYFRIKANYRPQIFEQLKKLKNTYSLHLLSGDNATEEAHLRPYFDYLRFDQKPQDKLNYVQSSNEKTLMVGDGLNDAGALRVAQVGFSVCEDIHQFSPACDALVHADSLQDISTILKFSKRVMTAVKVALVLSLVYNVVGLSFAITGNLKPVISAILMPVSSITVVGFITLTVNALGWAFARSKSSLDSTI